MSSTNWVPQVGAWAVMTLDPLATLVHEHLDDTEARDLIALFHPRKYVVYVAREGLHYRDPNPHGSPTYITEAHVELLMQGLPCTDRDACLDSGMCIPVFPETYHPTNERPPLVTSSPNERLDFPFRNAYLAPLTASLLVRAVAKQTDNELWMLSPRQQAAHNFWASQDCMKRDVWAQHGEGVFEKWWAEAGMESLSDEDDEDNHSEDGQTLVVPPPSYDKSLPPTPHSAMSTGAAGSIATSVAVHPKAPVSRKWYHFAQSSSPFPIPEPLQDKPINIRPPPETYEPQALSVVGPIPLDALVPMVTLCEDLFSVITDGGELDNWKLEPPEEFFKELQKLKVIAGGAVYRQTLLAHMAQTRASATASEFSDEDERRSVLSNSTNRPFHAKVSRVFSGLGKRVNSVGSSIRKASSIAEAASQGE
ncbi:hypothetical protein HMN09_00941400 [Mycena chlorophos]|uniref:Uncharacterized protein n=1 Tax=Mycena chlorophos TaxID=658473 RepID=A0A8H6SMJ4_MYCCL|nr:hypothetical protein HMN09_00941400 [Mycena chlorophos]